VGVRELLCALDDEGVSHQATRVDPNHASGHRLLGVDLTRACCLIHALAGRPVQGGHSSEFTDQFVKETVAAECY
jgi:hypothetical protein